MPKRRKARKPTRQEREALASFEKMQRRLDKLPKFAHSPVPPDFTIVQRDFSPVPPGRENTVKPKQGKFEKGVGAKPDDKVYTGDACMGISTLHKSNSVPVFSKEHAVDTAKMRRN